MNDHPGKLANLREDYQKAALEIQSVENNPIKQFDMWFNQAVDAQIKEPNAMTLATSSKNNRPSARIVLLKDYSEKGFVFYTNYNSRKGKELLENPYAALVFCWLDLERQIRIEGKVEKAAPETSERYFKSRPKGSQIGAWASPQSEIITSRNILQKNVDQLKAKYQNSEELPIPDHWGGYILIPDMIEFWQGRSSRLHDRIQYSLTENLDWRIDRLAP